MDYTTIEIKHGQTGVCMFLHWLLRQVFGANLFFLRLPGLEPGSNDQNLWIVLGVVA